MKHKSLLAYLEAQLAKAKTPEDRRWLKAAIATTLSMWELYEAMGGIPDMRKLGGKRTGQKARSRAEARYADLRRRYDSLKRRDKLSMTAAAARLGTSPSTLARALKQKSANS